MVKVATASNAQELGAENLLQKLGLDSASIVSYILKGQAKRHEATPHHPANAGGTFAYYETVRAVRDGLIPRGWQRKCVANLELTVSPCETIAVAVAGGNRSTGNRNENPCTRNPKGSETRRVIDRNEFQFTLDLGMSDLVFAEQGHASLNDYEVWWLLYYFDEKKKQVRCELSLPTGMDEKNRISEWRRRIILPAIDLSDSSGIEPSRNEESFSDEVEIDVVFREK